MRTCWKSRFKWPFRDEEPNKSPSLIIMYVPTTDLYILLTPKKFAKTCEPAQCRHCVGRYCAHDRKISGASKVCRCQSLYRKASTDQWMWLVPYHVATAHPTPVLITLYLSAGIISKCQYINLVDRREMTSTSHSIRYEYVTSLFVCYEPRTSSASTNDTVKNNCK